MVHLPFGYRLSMIANGLSVLCESTGSLYFTVLLSSEPSDAVNTMDHIHIVSVKRIVQAVGAATVTPTEIKQ